MSRPAERAANIRAHHESAIADLRRDIELHEVVIFVQDCIMEGVNARTTAEELRDVGLSGGDADTAPPDIVSLLDDLFTVDELDAEFETRDGYPSAANKDEKIAFVTWLYTPEDADDNSTSED